MNTHTDFQTILGTDGRPAFVVVPYEQFRQMNANFTPGTIPNTIVGKHIMDGKSLMLAWREYLHMTQAEIARRMGVTQAAYAQMETANRPRKATLQKVALALGVSVEQLLG